MGDMLSRWWWGGDPDEKNTISGMTLRNIYNVQRSWSTIFTNASTNGFLIFFRLFEADPETKTFFKSIAHLETRAEIAANVSFRAHVVNIMSSIDNSIKNLNQPELVVVWMEKLGDVHRAHNIERRHFEVFQRILVNILQHDLKLSDDVLASWNRYVAFIYEHLLPRLTS